MPRIHKQGHGGRKKHNRDLVKCTRYKNENRREKNKLKKLRKILKSQPNNKQIKRLIYERTI